MAIIKKEELLELIRTKLGDDSDDDSIRIIEDVTDTFTDWENRLSDKEDWKTKYEENDASWRKKYRDRFYEPSKEKEEEDEIEEDEVKTLKYEDLFKED